MGITGARNHESLHAPNHIESTEMAGGRVCCDPAGSHGGDVCSAVDAGGQQFPFRIRLQSITRAAYGLCAKLVVRRAAYLAGLVSARVPGVAVRRQPAEFSLDSHQALSA